uniref:Piwi domain-containing protein n=1 Tax=Caenorhabditis tropicalis TaxID=1561998 RepID=A0A1I7TXI8_9PELO
MQSGNSNRGRDTRGNDRGNSGRGGRGSTRGKRGGGQHQELKVGENSEPGGGRQKDHSNAVRGGRGSYRGRGGGLDQQDQNHGGHGARGSNRGGRGGYNQVPQQDQRQNNDQGERSSHRGGRGAPDHSPRRGQYQNSGGRGGRGGIAQAPRGRTNDFRGEHGRSSRGRGNSSRGGSNIVDNHSRPVETNERHNGMLSSNKENMDNPSKMNSNGNPRLAINIFGLELSERKIFRHVVQMKLLDNKTKKDHILTTMSAKGRGNRASKQKDNFLLLKMLLDKWAAKRGSNNTPVFAYDGAQSLFTLEGISERMVIKKDDALQIADISEFLKDSVKFLSGDLEISCEPDHDKPFFVQTEIREWSDPRFYAYLDIVTSQGAIRSGKYLSQSKGLYVNTSHMTELRAKWAVAAQGIHKGCRIVGSTGPLPVLELDPQSTQYYAPIPLSQMIQLAFPRDFNANRGVNPNMRLQRAVKLLLKDLKCNPFYEDLRDWATNTITVSDIDYNAHKDNDYKLKYPNLRFPYLPAAQCGTGPSRRLMPLEYLKVLPYQSIDRRVLEEFELTPRANAPNERWQILQKHYDEFGFNNEVMIEFGVLICNDPFQNISEIDGERVLAPKISYADPVHVDDEKRDWKAQDKKFAKAAVIDHLVFVLVAGYTRNFKDDIRATEYVARAFMQRCQDKGMTIRNYELQTHEGERDSEAFLTSVFKKLVTHPKYRDSSFIPFVLFVSDDVPNIHECLKFEERMSDIPTQHVLLKNIRKIRDNMERKSGGGRRAYDLTLDNIVMKANIKCGGLNYTADIPRDIACWNDTPTFVMGMDVAHPDRLATREGNPSTVGLSCNAAEHPYSFIGDFLYTDPRREAIQDEILRKFTDQNVRNFAEIRGFPKKIIIFRDGVSFGEESEALREVEIIEQTIISAAMSMGLRDYAPKVLAIVVKKRHHTRFYAKGGHNGMTPSNPLPDTSVGGDIAEYGKRQIFIQAFRPVQGTAKVPSFLILRDDEEVSDEHISKMVCAVCSLHQLVNSPTSIPTPVYVAHELAKRGTGLFKAYRFKNGELRDDWDTLTNQLSYSTLDRLSKVRVV